jgi:hypothetical protein
MSLIFYGEIAFYPYWLAVSGSRKFMDLPDPHPLLFVQKRNRILCLFNYLLSVKLDINALTVSNKQIASRKHFRFLGILKVTKE